MTCTAANFCLCMRSNWANVTATVAVMDSWLWLHSNRILDCGCIQTENKCQTTESQLPAKLCSWLQATLEVAVCKHEELQHTKKAQIEQHKASDVSDGLLIANSWALQPLPATDHACRTSRHSKNFVQIPETQHRSQLLAFKQHGKLVYDKSRLPEARLQPAGDFLQVRAGQGKTLTCLPASAQERPSVIFRKSLRLSP